MTNDGMYLAEGHGYLCGIPSTGIYKITAVVEQYICTFFVAVGYVHFFKCAEKNGFGHADCSEGLGR